MKRARILGASSGFTLIETVIALVIFTALGYGLAIAAAVGSNSQREVSRVASENKSLRDSISSLVDELRSTSDANVTLALLADGNTRLRFMMPIVDAGANSWGVYDRRLGSTPALQNRANWLVQYTVRSAQIAGGATERQLVRQILDTALAVQREDVLAHGLRSGTDVPPGFKVAKNGAIWEVTLSTDGPDNGNSKKSTVMHVKTRN
jgi:prepilin-type N-terminal cleavage/methylation domain-containing protein